MVEIYLSLREDQICFLSIPLRDVQRLAFRPFKWLRFVVFCTCGAKGQLSATPNGPPVDYDAGISSLTDDDKYYYTAGGTFFENVIMALQFPYPGTFIFVDPYCLDEKMTSAAHTTRRTSFRTEIVKRDGPSCVVTALGESDCEAAHFMPFSKGDEVTTMIIHCSFSMTVYPSTLRRLSMIVLLFMGCHHRPLPLMTSQMVCWCQGLCIHSSLMDLSPS